ncbi:MAG: Mor transcription activator family protein [Giesbergeria sp.]|nr:Mor transcription activator family protein [Giesbergeria sp.]
MPDEPSDLFSLLEAEARAVAAAFGVVTANELAAALVDRMHHRITGSKVHIAKRSRARRQEAYAALRRDFNGVNLREVAARHGFSARHARRILEK